MRLMVRSSTWLGFYLLLILFPLLAGAIFRPQGAADSIYVNFSAALGYIGFALMALEMALLSRIDGAAGVYGLDALQLFHKQIGIVALLLVLAHPLLLVFGGYPWRMFLFVPGVPWSIQLGVLALLTVAVLIALSVWRKQLRLRYEFWQATHGLLTILLLAAALGHILAAGRYAQMAPMRWAMVAYFALLIGLFAYYRLWKPWRHLRQPWRVVENRVELGNSRTLRLQPEGHAGWGFEPGQFAWINLGKSPFQFEQHPISMSSCGDCAGSTGEIAFTIRDLGDWSGKKVQAVKPGDRVWLDGPYGVFTLDRIPAPGYALLAGGVGITPLHAMLATMAAREDMRPVVLFFAGKNLDSLTLRDEVLALQDKINLKVVLVLSEAPDHWQGESGRISAEILRRYLPARQYTRWEYFICGPTPMIDAMEDLLPEIGVPLERIHSERFDMV